MTPLDKHIYDTMVRYFPGRKIVIAHLLGLVKKEMPDKLRKKTAAEAFNKRIERRTLAVVKRHEEPTIPGLVDAVIMTQGEPVKTHEAATHRDAIKRQFMTIEEWHWSGEQMKQANASALKRLAETFAKEEAAWDQWGRSQWGDVAIDGIKKKGEEDGRRAVPLSGRAGK
jgi:hypothetical protein